MAVTLPFTTVFHRGMSSYKKSYILGADLQQSVVRWRP